MIVLPAHGRIALVASHQEPMSRCSLWFEFGLMDIIHPLPDRFGVINNVADMKEVRYRDSYRVYYTWYFIFLKLNDLDFKIQYISQVTYASKTYHICRSSSNIPYCAYYLWVRATAFALNATRHGLQSVIQTPLPKWQLSSM